MKRLLFILLVGYSVTNVHAQNNVGIGTSTPHPSAALDVQSADKGVLVPRIALTATNVAAPVTNPAEALLIYNTATTGTGSNAVTPGFYYWNATASKWTAIGGSNSSSTSGNIGYGAWGDCQTSANIGDYQPVAETDGFPDDELGTSVSMSGNFAAITVPHNNVGRGAVLIYFFDGTSWVFKQKITASDAADNDNFGDKVSLSGTRLVVTAPYDDIGSNVNQGSAYVFSYNGTNWVQQQKLTATDGAANDYFGVAVCISGNHIAVGATGNQGAIYFYYTNGISCPLGVCWQLKNKIVSPNTADAFGFSVHISGNRCIVGAISFKYNSVQSAGIAYLLSYNGSNWVYPSGSIMLPRNPTAFGQSGFSVCLAGDFIFIGAPGVNNDKGRVDVYTLEYGSPFFLQEITEGDFRFGVSLSNEGDFVMIGSEETIQKGAIYIYQRIGKSWRKYQKVVDPGGEYNDLFGHSTAISNKRFIIGAPSNFSLATGRAVFGKIN